MRTGQRQTAKLGAMAAAVVLAAATANLNRKTDEPVAYQPAPYSRPNWREAGRRSEVPNKTKRGLRRRVTRGRH
jgi:phage repressor protein C with HTH and peptisase S24 domain